MSKVIQIRGVPDDVHARLVAAAEKAGQSLTTFVGQELARAAQRADLAWHNEQVILEGQRAVGARRISDDALSAARDSGRAERDEQLDAIIGKRQDAS